MEVPFHSLANCTTLLHYLSISDQLHSNDVFIVSLQNDSRNHTGNLFFTFYFLRSAGLPNQITLAETRKNIATKLREQSCSSVLVGIGCGSTASELFHKFLATSLLPSAISSSIAVESGAVLRYYGDSVREFVVLWMCDFGSFSYQTDRELEILHWRRDFVEGEFVAAFDWVAFLHLASRFKSLMIV